MNLICDDVLDLAPGFVLGALEASQMAAVREHLAECPEAHAEVDRLGSVVPYLDASLEPVEPPAGLRARLLEAAGRDQPGLVGAAAVGAAGIEAGGPTETAAMPAAPAAPAAPGPAPTPAPAPIPFPAAEERDRRTQGRRDRIGRWGMGLAAVLALAVLGGWNLQLQSHLSSVEADLAAAQAYQRGVAAVLDVGTRSGAQTAFLAATKPELKASGVAAAAPDGTLVMAIHDLVPTTGSQVYEAWVIVGQGAPVPLGGFTVAADGMGVLRSTTSLAMPGAVLALSLEPGPDATAPAGPVVTSGSLRAPAPAS